MANPLVMTNIAMVKPWPIEIDGLPSENGGSFHSYVSLPGGKSEMNGTTSINGYVSHNQC